MARTNENQTSADKAKQPKQNQPKKGFKQYIPKPPKMQRTQIADKNRGAKRRTRRATINWGAEDAKQQWLDNVTRRADELRKGVAK